MSRRLGHSSTTITSDHYGHVIPAAAKRAAVSFAEALGAAGAIWAPDEAPEAGPGR